MLLAAVAHRWFVTKCSQDTALKDIFFLIEVRILERGDADGRSTSYSLANSAAR